MSSDNYGVVDYEDGEYIFKMGFASDDQIDPRERARFKTRKEIKEYISNEIIEYGVTWTFDAQAAPFRREIARLKRIEEAARPIASCFSELRKANEKDEYLSLDFHHEHVHRFLDALAAKGGTEVHHGTF